MSFVICLLTFILPSERTGQTDDSTGNAGTSVSGRGGFFVASLSEIIDFALADARPTDDRLSARELDESVFVVQTRDSIFTGFNVAHVTNVAHFGVRTTVDGAVRVEMGSSSLASLNQVSL